MAPTSAAQTIIVFASSEIKYFILLNLFPMWIVFIKTWTHKFAYF